MEKNENLSKERAFKLKKTGGGPLEVVVSAEADQVMGIVPTDFIEHTNPFE